MSNDDGDKLWRIDGRNYGTVFGRGTEAEAEEWRAHKGSWEGYGATKQEVDESEVPRGRAVECFKELLGYQ